MIFPDSLSPDEVPQTRSVAETLLEEQIVLTNSTDHGSDLADGTVSQEIQNLGEITWQSHVPESQADW